ncbi:NAD-dependent succinate-semialdehyde dehydrogenase [Aggregicoccus sp. 17bor-14]|uniref:NAD-dependent succinate-semialdehyde dehydrogenase n=1 Tax=Myxococcaceae TaxID=31 RepID=UPI00129CFA41|nr:MULTISPECIES: NAD-dependent succinate-semialdehyde dehydrogenase [Myxococcaceae]MBF5041617.1 NAD-dependent succinate-semialdehyde dehydrogenase [Simulacricoccus sp. 17bor-14]MRI87402.1 NAD-dependent succinate-semialdehyde dehydrogenase [Aggregicoccus sp. 17bor-14]
MAMKSVDPRSGKVLETFEEHDDAEVERRLALAATAFTRHRVTPFSQRSKWMARAGELLDTEKAQIARMMTLEMGKTLASAVAEVEKCAWVCRYYAENAERHLADEDVKTNAERSYVRYEPLGPVLAVMPWNFPLWQVFRFAAPALMAGNVGLLKHASNVPRCALAIEDVFKRAGFPEGCFQTLLVGSKRVEALINDGRVKAVTLTGSEAAGRSVGEQSGRALKKSVLELGGSDPFIVMPSADQEKAAETAVKARIINNGQSCIAAKRFIVADAIFDAFRDRFVQRMQRLVMGDPLEAKTDLGPLATESIRKELHAQVERMKKAGGRVLTGGVMPDGPGYFYPGTVVVDLPPDSDIAKEEVFGPVAVLYRVRDREEALARANGIPFGLGSSVWTRDAAERDFFVAGLEAGSVFVNAMVSSDPRLPFGGVKASGYGRELAAFGIREFCNVKTVWWEGSQAGQPPGLSE